MSLVNDLLIELDREDADARAKRDASQTSMKARKPPRRSVRRSTIASLCAALAAGVFVATALIVVMEKGPLPIPSVSARPIVERVTVLAEPQTNAESTPPTTQVTTQSVASASIAVPDERIARPALVRGIKIERRAGFTRLRFETDPGLQHHVERDLAGRHVQVRFFKASLAGPIANLDLVGTPIQSVTTQHDAEGIQVILGFDPQTQIRTQTLAAPEHTTLFLDIEGRSSSSISRPDWRTPRVREHRIAAEPQFSPPPEIPAAAALASPASSETETASIPEVESSTTLEIERSELDRARQDLDVRHQKAMLELTAARTATQKGELDEADRRYAAALELNPSNRDATIEHAALLADTGRLSEAIESVRRARLIAKKDASLAMLHARLFERAGHIEDAILLLDRAGLTLTQAPEVYALAAAFLQKNGQHREAIARYETIVRRYPSESSWWMGLGISLEAQQREAEALDVYRIAIQTGDLSQPSRRWVAARVDAISEEG